MNSPVVMFTWVRRSSGSSVPPVAERVARVELDHRGDPPDQPVRVRPVHPVPAADAVEHRHRVNRVRRQQERTRPLNEQVAGRPDGPDPRLGEHPPRQRQPVGQLVAPAAGRERQVQPDRARIPVPRVVHQGVLEHRRQVADLADLGRRRRRSRRRPAGTAPAGRPTPGPRTSSRTRRVAGSAAGTAGPAGWPGRPRRRTGRTRSRTGPTAAGRRGRSASSRRTRGPPGGG